MTTACLLTACLLLVSGCGEPAETEVAELLPPPGGQATVTYRNAQRIVEMTRGLKDTSDHVVRPFRDQIAADRDQLNQKEN